MIHPFAPALFVSLVTGVLASLFAFPADAEEDPRRWLDDMNSAFADLSYDGVFSYYSGQDLATLRIVHMVVGGEQRERLVHLNGAPRQILRRGEEVICMVAPDDALLALGEDMPAGPFADAFVRNYQGLSEYYGLSFFGEDRVADRPAVRLALTPRDSHRFGYRLWLDRATRLLLRSELIDVNGDRLEIFQFSQIRIGDEVDPAALEPDDRSGTLVSHLTLASKEAQPLGDREAHWESTWLPGGFTLASADVRRAPGSNRLLSRMMYSDGLAAFSVFVESMPDPDAASMESRNGATVAVTKLVADQAEAAVDAKADGARTPAKPHLVTVVGEIPVATARRIAASIRPRSES
jgi:sigma-E factor negative regulatory protein RseB